MTQTVFQGKYYRITILTNQLARMEYSVEGQFENRPTQTIVNRIFEEPEVSFSETEDQLDIHTPNMDLFMRKRRNLMNILSQWMYVLQQGICIIGDLVTLKGI